MTTLLPTKFFVPPLPSNYLPRPHLLKKLDEALTHCLTLVSAPAGAGKTLLVSAWLESIPKKGAVIGWLSLDEGDNDPARFLDYLVASLEEGGLLIDIPGIQALASPAQAEHTLAEIIRGMLPSSAS